MKDYLRNCDLFGAEADFHSGSGLNNKKFKNVFGGLTSIICVLGVFAASVYFLSQFISRRNLTLMSNIITTEDVTIKDFKEFPIFFKLTMTSARQIAEPNKVWKATINLATLDPAISSTFSRVFLKMEQCNSTVHFTKYKELIEKSVPDFNSFYCVNWGNMTSFDLKGSYGSASYNQFLQIRIRPCSVEAGDTPCLDKKSIDTILSDAYMDYRTLDIVIDNNQMDIKSEYIYGERIGLSYTVFRRLLFFYREVYYNSDYGLVFEEKSMTDFNQFDFYRTETDIRQYNDLNDLSTYKVFAWINIVLGKTRVIYERTYLKAQSALANLGGIIQVLMTLGTIINYPISHALYDIELSNSIVNFIVQEKDVLNEQETIEVKQERQTRNLNEFKENKLEPNQKQIRANKLRIAGSNKKADNLINKFINENIVGLDCGGSEASFSKEINKYNKVSPKFADLMQIPQIALVNPIKRELRLKCDYSKGKRLDISLIDVILPKSCTCKKELRNNYDGKLQYAYDTINIFNYIKLKQEFSIIKHFLFDSKQLELISKFLNKHSDNVIISKPLSEHLIERSDVSSKLSRTDS